MKKKLSILYKLQFHLGYIGVNMDIKDIQNNKGAALVMALMILSLMMVSVLALSKVILSEVKMTSNTSNAISAFYAADAGLEKSLYYLKYARRNLDDLTFFTGLEDNEEDLQGSDASLNVLTASYQAEGYTATNVSTSSPAHLSIIDPIGDVGSTQWDAIGPNYLYDITWYIDDCFPTHSSDRLEVTVNSFNDNYTNQYVDTDIIVCDCSEGLDMCNTSVSRFNILPTKYYNFTFKPLDAEVSSLDFALKKDGVRIGILSETYIQSQGKYHNSKYNLEARVPSVAPVSDIFSYVIFSEQDIVK